MLSRSQAETFRTLTIGDEASVRRLTESHARPQAELGPQAESLVRLGALIIIDPSLPAYQAEVGRALDAGASPGQITAVLLAVAPICGSPRVVSAAPKLAMALGYDVEAAFEAP